MINYIIYGIYNLLYQVFSLWLLVYAAMFFNGRFIPDNLLWKDGKQREDMSSYLIVQAFIMIIQAIILMLVMYFINKWYLSSIAKANNSKSIAMWTAGIYAAITITLIVVTNATIK